MEVQYFLIYNEIPIHYFRLEYIRLLTYFLILKNPIDQWSDFELLHYQKTMY